jgi:hypothetical protein
MKRIRLYVAIDIEEEVPTEDLPHLVADVLEDVIGKPLFVGAVVGYTDEFREYGADPSSWEKQHDCDACNPKNPCALCKRREGCGGEAADAVLLLPRNAPGDRYRGGGRRRLGGRL